MNHKVLLAVAMLGLSMVPAQAQGPRGPRDGSGTAVTAEQMIQRRVERLTTLLTLTPSQVTTITALYTAEHTAVAAQRTAMDTAQEALKTAVQSNLPEAQIDQAAARVGTVHGQIAAIHAKTQAKFLAALTAEQRQKLESLGEGRGGMNGMGGMGGMRHRGGPQY